MRLIAALVLLASTAAAHAQVRQFVFAGSAAPGTTAVAPTRVFADGYGYEPGQPGLFSVALPPGNYRVTVRLGDPHAVTETTIKAESRRLMLDRVVTRAGQTAIVSFVVNIRNAALAPPPPTAPGGDHVLLKPREQGSYTWDDKLTLEILGAHPGVRSLTVEPVTVPTLFLLGDSTVTDQRFEPAASWGQMLPAFFAPTIAIANHAESGETLKSFFAELRLAKILELARPGDWAMIQFGHNDQKVQWPQTYAEAATTYRDYLRTTIAELRRRGVTPVLVTSPERRTFDAAGRIRSTLADYVAAMKAVGAEEQVSVIDLNAASARVYEALGPARASLAFNDRGRDATHHDNYGAWVLARAVAAGVADAKLALAASLRPDLPPFDPAHPPAPERFGLVPSNGRDATRPEGS